MNNHSDQKKDSAPLPLDSAQIFCLGRDLDECDIRSKVSACVYDPVVQFLLRKKKKYVYIIYEHVFG